MATHTTYKFVLAAAAVLAFAQPTYAQLGIPLPKQRTPATPSADKPPADASGAARRPASGPVGGDRAAPPPDGTVTSTGMPKRVDNTKVVKDSPSKTLGRAGLQSGK